LNARISNRREFLTASGIAAAVLLGLTAPLRALATATPSPTPFPWTDADLLQTLASIENLAVATYAQILALPAGLNGTDNTFLAATFNTAVGHHQAHAQQLNAALSGLGAAPQNGVDTSLQSDVVGTNLAKAQTVSDVLGVIVGIEDASAQTYVRFSADTTVPDIARMFALTAPVEAQHVTSLLMLEALVSGDELSLLGSSKPLPADAVLAGLTTAEIGNRHSRRELEGKVS
jgi:Ferritin-like domain